MSNSDYLKRYLGTAPENNDYKQPSKKKKKKIKAGLNITKKPKAQALMKIIDTDISGWDNTSMSLQAERNFTDVGLDAPTIVEDVRQNEKDAEALKSKWKKPSFQPERRKRHDSSDSESDSDASIDRSVAPSKTEGKSRRHDSSSSENPDSNSEDSDSDLDVRNPTKQKQKDSKTQPNAYQIIQKGQEKTVFRDKTGRAKNILDKRIADDEAARKKLENKEKWDKWSAGISTSERKKDYDENLQHEMNKPLARLADDEDLNNYQKSITRLDDPMLKYFKNKEEKARKKQGHYPEYKGVVTNPNRFNIRPGYRWDGVDRSNNFEKKYFDKQSSLKSLREHEIRFMTEDM